MKATNSKVMDKTCLKKKFLKEVEGILEIYCLEYLMDEVEDDDIGDVYANLEILMDDTRKSKDKAGLEDLTDAYEELKRAERRYCDEVNSINK